MICREEKSNDVSRKKRWFFTFEQALIIGVSWCLMLIATTAMVSITPRVETTTGMIVYIWFGDKLLKKSICLKSFDNKRNRKILRCQNYNAGVSFAKETLSWMESYSQTALSEKTRMQDGLSANRIIVLVLKKRVIHNDVVERNKELDGNSEKWLG